MSRSAPHDYSTRMRDSIRTILLLGPYPPPFGGVSVHVARLTQLLRRSGYQVNVLAKGDADGRSGDVVTARGRWGYLRAVLRLAPQASVIHDHTPHYQILSPLFSAMSYMALRLSRRPRVLTVHDGTFTQRVARAGAIVRRLMEWYLALYDEILVISENLLTTVRSLRVPKERIHLVRTFLVESDRAEPLPPQAETFVREHTPVWLVAGAYHPTYHFDAVAEAFRMYQKDHPQAGLILVSGGFISDAEFRARVNHAVAGVEAHILNMTDVKPGVLHELYDHADIFIRSAYPDGDGVSLREAILGRCAVVATETGERPAGVPCYRFDDPADLVRVVETMNRGAEDHARDTMREVTRRLADANARLVLETYDRLQGF